MGKNSTCKTAKIHIINSQMIQKYNLKKRQCFPVVNMPLEQARELQASICKCIYIYQIELSTSVKTLTICTVLLSEKKVQVNKKITDMSFYCIFRKCLFSFLEKLLWKWGLPKARDMTSISNKFDHIKNMAARSDSIFCISWPFCKYKKIKSRHHLLH